MVRVLLIRHGESEENETLHNLFDMLQRKEISGKQAIREGMKDKMVDDGDSPLTALGRQQVEELGTYWAPMLAHKAATGGLHAFVSPFTRTMCTADPLLSILHDNFGVIATIRPELGEVPGLVARDDTELVDQAEDLATQGKVEEALEKLRTHKWRACGMTPSQLTQKFPWARLANSSLSDHPTDLPWYTSGWERPSVAAARGEVNRDFLRSLQSTLPNDDVVVLVAHGLSLGILLRTLLTSGSSTVSMFNEVENTSVTSLFLASPSVQGDGNFFMPMGLAPHFPQRAPLTTAKLEFFNRVDHLSGTPTMQNWMLRKGVMKKAHGGSQIQAAAASATLKARL